MPDYRRSVQVSADPAVLWAVTSDVARWPQWLPTVSSVERLDPGPLADDSRTRVRQPRLPASVWEVVEYAEGRVFSWTSSSAGVTTRATHEVRGAATGSELVLTVEQTGLLAPVAWLLLGRLTRRYVDQEAAATKARAESESESPRA